MWDWGDSGSEDAGPEGADSEEGYVWREWGTGAAPVYPGVSSLGIPHLDSGPVASSCPLCSQSLLQHLRTSFFKLEAFPLRPTSQAQNASNIEHGSVKIQTSLSWKKIFHLDKRLISARSVYFSFLSTRKGGGWYIYYYYYYFLVNVLSEKMLLKSSENTISFEKKKLKALLQTKL